MSIKSYGEEAILDTTPGSEAWPRSALHDILVLASGHRDCPTPAMEVGGALAIHHQAALSVCLFDAREPTARRHEPSVLGLLEEPDRMALAPEDVFGFSSWARGLALKRAHLCLPRASLDEAAIELAPWHDLIVADRDLLQSLADPGLLAGPLHRSQVPWLIVPPNPSGTLDLTSVAIAWDGSAPATRAFKHAIPLIQMARRVHVREAIFGGVTRHVLAEGDVAVWLAS